MTDIPFGIRSFWEDDTVVFEVAGEMDMATAPELESAIDGIQDAARRVVVDLSGSTFLDSAAINTLIRCQRELAQRGVGMTVVSPLDGVVRKALEITNVLDQLGVVDSRADVLD